MKMSTLDEAMQKRFSAEEISEIEAHSKLLGEYYMDLQKSISQAVKDFAEEKNMSFADIQSSLNTSKSQTSRILSAGSNFTLDTIMKISRLTGKRPRLIFE